MFTKPTFSNTMSPKDLPVGVNKKGEVEVKEPIVETEQRKLKELAACWVKIDKNGKEYLSLKLKINGEQNLQLFKNPKYDENHPNLPAYIAYRED